MKLIARVFILTVTVVMFGCGGGPTGAPPAPNFTAPNVTGQWEFQAQDGSGNVTIIETNLGLNSVSTPNIYAASSGQVLVVNGTLSGNQVLLQDIGLPCDNGTGQGDGPLELTFTSPTESNFSLFGTTGDGPGAFQVSGSLTFNSNTGATGQYSAPAVCGVAADVGTVTGVEIKPFTGTYSGVLNDGDVLIVSVSEDPSTFSFLVVGTDNGAPLNLTGAVQGGAWTVSGTINGEATDAVGLYDPTGDDFLVYSVNPLTFLGTLHSGSNPQAAVKQGKFIGKKD